MKKEVQKIVKKKKLKPSDTINQLYFLCVVITMLFQFSKVLFLLQKWREHQYNPRVNI